MAFFIFLLVVILFLTFLNYKSFNEIKKLASDNMLDKQVKNLPCNKKICEEIQQMVGSNCEIKIDDESKSSAYIFFLNKIILSNIETSRKSYSRVMFIAHECVHSIQDKLSHIINFLISNFRNVYDLILFFLILFRKCSWDFIGISFLIAFIYFYYRMILETDAVYRSVIFSRKYLEIKNMSNIADRYEEIVPKTIRGMYFSYIMPILIREAFLTLFFIIIS